MEIRLPPPSTPSSGTSALAILPIGGYIAWQVCYGAGEYDTVTVSMPPAPLGFRSREAIEESQVEKIRGWWEALGGEPEQLEIDCSPRSKTVFDEAKGIVRVGADINPGPGLNPNTRLRWRAALAHEYTHLKRHQSGRAGKQGPLEEAITSLEACLHPEVTEAMCQELIAEALQRLNQVCVDQEARGVQS